MGFFKNPKKAFKGFIQDPTRKISNDLNKMANKISGPEEEYNTPNDIQNDPFDIGAAIIELICDGISGNGVLVNSLRAHLTSEESVEIAQNFLYTNKNVSPENASNLASLLGLDINNHDWSQSLGTYQIGEIDAMGETITHENT
ncbi:MAG: hypothetical protein KA998_04005 [Rickettsiaceae bacterium]|nr:hypothetical protein [Rickettsiaceae bacterium]